MLLPLVPMRRMGTSRAGAKKVSLPKSTAWLPKFTKLSKFELNGELFFSPELVESNLIFINLVVQAFA
jgi:hypothetical protein